MTGKSAGAQAIELIQNEHFDVVTTDRKMPVVDGFSVAEVVRHVDRVLGRPRTPVLMCTIRDVPKECAGAEVQDRWAPSTKRRAKQLSISLLRKPMMLPRLESVLHLIAKMRMGRVVIGRSILPVVRNNGDFAHSFIVDSLHMMYNMMGSDIIVAKKAKLEGSVHHLTKLACGKRFANDERFFISC